MTMYDNRTKLSYEVWQEVINHYPDKVFRTAIPRTIRLVKLQVLVKLFSSMIPAVLVLRHTQLSPRK